jgi:hypothetical protein
MNLNKHLFLNLAFCLAAIPFLNAQDKFTQPKTPLPFMENKGQIIDQNNHTNTSVLYQLALPGLNVSLKKDGFSYDTWLAEDLGEDKELKEINKKHQGPSPHKYNYKFHRIDVNFLGANPLCVIEPQERTSDYTMYYTTGTPEEGAKVLQYGKVLYRNLYHNIDLEFVAAPGTNKPVEYNFIVHPGADVTQIKMRYTGALDAALKNGALLLQLAHTELTESIPASWIKESKEAVQVSYKQFAHDQNSITIGFATNYQSKNNTLIIDPTPNLDWGTYYGGTGNEYGSDIATDATGNVLVTGYTSNTSGIATTGAHQITYGGGFSDAFIVKFNASGIRQWGTYYGGNGEDRGLGITCDASGNVFVTGDCAFQSTSGIATAGAHQVGFGGGLGDAFIVKFNASGIRQWGTYYGGPGPEAGIGITADTAGNVLVTGNTSSDSGIATTGAHKTTYGGGSYDAFIVKFNASGIRQWGTYYGGTSTADYGYSIVTDTSGYIFLTGATESNTGIATIGTHQEVFGGINDAYIVKFNSSGIRQWGTYYGGTDDDSALDITTDASGNILVSGATGSNTGIATIGAHQETYGDGGTDAFIIKFNASGIRQWGTYYGGTDQDFTNSISTDALDNVLVMGFTRSSTAIATTGAHQTINGGNNFGDAFIVKFKPSGIRQWGTYYGGTLGDIGQGIATDASGNVFVTGWSESTSAIASTGAHQSTYGGGVDAFIARFSCIASTSTTYVSICDSQLPYNWNGNNYNAAGIYNLTFTNFAGCDSIATLNLIVNNSSNLIPSISSTPTTCGLPNGSITSNITGGSSPYTYSWSNNASVSNISDLIPGSYTLTVTDATGCSASTSAIIGSSICPKVLSQSVSNITQTTASVSWPAVSCANKYRIIITKVGSGTQTTIVVLAPNTTYNLTGLLPNTTYQVRMRTQCSQNGTVVSQLSPISSFTTLNNQGIQCLPPSNITTSNLLSNSVSINWTPALGAIQYILRYRIISTPSWTNTIISNGGASSITLQNLLPESNYEFQLRTKCNNNPDEFSSFSTVYTFTTPALRIEEYNVNNFDAVLYPNPADKNINLEILSKEEKEIQITITDLLGREILKETEFLINGNTIITYNIENYAIGIYLVQIQNGIQRTLLRFMK